MTKNRKNIITDFTLLHREFIMNIQKLMFLSVRCAPPPPTTAGPKTKTAQILDAKLAQKQKNH